MFRVCPMTDWCTKRSYVENEACFASSSFIDMVDSGEILQEVCSLTIGSLPLVYIKNL